MKNLSKFFGTQKVLLCVIALLVFLFASCNRGGANANASRAASANSASQPERTGRAAMFTHNDCIGEAVVVRRGDTVVSVTLDDYFGPQGFGNITNMSNRGDVDTIAIGNDVWAKSIRVGTEVFTIADGATEPAYAGTYRGAAIPNLQVWLGRTTTRQGGNYGDNVPQRTADEWMWYVDACKNGQVVYLNASGAPASVAVTYYGSNSRLGKNSSTYWGADGTPPAQASTLGWKVNREAVEAYVRATNGQYPDPLGGRANGGNTGNMTRRRDNIWQFSSSDVVTGATMVDTPNYLKVIQLAYENAR
jgi:hypothetical protein